MVFGHGNLDFECEKVISGMSAVCACCWYWNG